MRILIVDDHPTNRKLLRVTLEAEGLTTVEASDGMQALAVLQAEPEQPVDAIVSDIFMPGMDGFRFCHAVRKSERFGHLPFVIYTSTYTSADDEKLALEAGADRYIRKPCPTATLVSALHEVVAAAQQRALQRPQPIEDLEVTREYSEALIKKLEEKNAGLEQAMARQEMIAELSQRALTTSSPLVSAVGQATLGAVPRQSAQPRSGEDGLDVLFGQAARMVASALDVRYCAIWEALPDGRTLRCQVGRDELDPDGECATPTISGAGSEGPISGVTIRERGSPVTSEETGTLAVVIPGLDRPFGFLEASAGAPRRFREEDIHFLEAIAGVLATALWRQDAEEELLRQREWLHVTLTSIGDGAIASDAGGLTTFVNPIAALLTGWTQEEALGQPIQQVFNIINAQTRQPAEDLCARVLKERHAVSLVNNTALLARDGREVAIEESAAPILDVGGEPAGVVLVFHDVTEKRQAQAALRESEERFRSLAEGLPELVWVSDADGKATYLNPQYRAYAGVEPAMVEERAQLIHPEDLPRVAESWTEMIHTATDFEGEYRLRRHDGQYRWFLTRCVLKRTPSGEIDGWIGTSTDIHDQKQAEELLEHRVRERTADLQASEERFRQLAESMQEVFWMFEPGTGRLLYVSPAYDAIWGRSRQGLYERPTSFADTVHSDDRQQMLQEFTSDRRAHDHEFRIVRPDGTLRWIRLRSFPIYDDKGEIYRLAGVATDRTEQKAAEDALFHAEQLTIAGRLAASLAHEINNPLQAVIGCLGLANEVLENGEDPRNYLQIAYEEVQRTARIVHQLRSLVHPVQDGHKEPTDLNSLLNDILVLNRKHLQTRKVEVSWDSDAGLPLLTIMPGQMRQVFLNLVFNAADAMPEGGHLSLSTTRSESPSGVRIVVADTGSGIPPNVLPHIFEAFYSTKSDGLGMGLFVSQNIVQRHGGRIEVESQPGVGSTFTVWLPV